METQVSEYTVLLEKARAFAATLGLAVHNSATLDPFYKGDMDGKNIWISFKMDDEDELFNVLHLIGHCIQWGTDKELMKLGCVLHLHPDDELLTRLQEYEWGANCYAYSILVKLGGADLKDWLFNNYREDMLYLTNFYLTGEKKREITALALAHSWIRPLDIREIPKFVPEPIEGTRNGIVIDFKN